MKKLFVGAFAIFSLIIITGAANFRPIPPFLETEKIKKTCVGYTIIAFDKGIDCYGDTIRLVRKNGFAERVTGNRLPGSR